MVGVFGEDEADGRLVAAHAATEDVDEGASELATQRRIQHEVDRGVDDDQQVANIVDDENPQEGVLGQLCGL